MTGVEIEREVDNRRRLLLAGVGDPEHTRYRVDVRHDGSILLRPVVSVLARDLVYAEDQERSRISSGIVTITDALLRQALYRAAGGEEVEAIVGDLTAHAVDADEELRLRVDELESLLFDASRGEHRLDDSCWCRPRVVTVPAGSGSNDDASDGHIGPLTIDE